MFSKAITIFLIPIFAIQMFLAGCSGIVKGMGTYSKNMIMYDLAGNLVNVNSGELLKTKSSIIWKTRVDGKTYIVTITKKKNTMVLSVKGPKDKVLFIASIKEDVVLFAATRGEKGQWNAKVALKDDPRVNQLKENSLMNLTSRFVDWNGFKALAVADNTVSVPLSLAAFRMILKKNLPDEENNKTPRMGPGGIGLAILAIDAVLIGVLVSIYYSECDAVHTQASCVIGDQTGSIDCNQCQGIAQCESVLVILAPEDDEESGWKCECDCIK